MLPVQLMKSLASVTWVQLLKPQRWEVTQVCLLPEVSYRISPSPWQRDACTELPWIRRHVVTCPCVLLAWLEGFKQLLVHDRGTFSRNWEGLGFKVRAWFSGKKIVSYVGLQGVVSASHLFPPSPFSCQMKDTNLLQSQISSKSLSTTQWPLCRQGYKGHSYFFSFAWTRKPICNLAVSYGNQWSGLRSQIPHSVSVQHWANACHSREIVQTFIHRGPWASDGRS